MAERTLPPPLRDAVQRLGAADIMVGIPSYRNAATIGHVVRAAQAGLVQYFPDLRPVVVNADAGSSDGTGSAARFDTPQGIALFSRSINITIDLGNGLNGYAYVADTNNSRIQKFGPLPTPTKLMSWGRMKVLYR